MLKGVVVAHFKILAQQSPEGTEGCHEILQANGVEM
jgi:hypothetical protein